MQNVLCLPELNPNFDTTTLLEESVAVAHETVAHVLKYMY